MRLPFRQGVVKHSLPDLVEVNGQFVSLIVVDQPVIVTIAAGEKDYLYVEQYTVENAWNTPANTDAWLYLDIDNRTGQRTFGYTLLQPIVSSTAPTAPATDQHWFDTTAKTTKVWGGATWRQRNRVFICKLADGSVPVSLYDSPTSFTGTQVGINTESFAGAIVFDAKNLPVKSSDGTFITTEDSLRSRVLSTTDVKLATIVIEAETRENIPKYSVVCFSAFGEIVAADIYTTALPGQYGLIQRDVTIGELVHVITDGAVTNLEWDWSFVGVNKYLYINGMGGLTPVPTTTDQIPCATIIDKHTILFGTPKTTVIGNVLIESAAVVFNYTANQDLLLQHAQNIVLFNSAIPVSFMLKTDSAVPVPVGTTVVVGQSGTGQVTINSDVGVVVRTPETRSIRKQNGKVTATKVANNLWDLEGNLETAIV